MSMLHRIAAVTVPVVLVVGLAPTPAQAAEVTTTYATFQGWVAEDKRSGATWDTNPNDAVPLTGQCVAMGTHGVAHQCGVRWEIANPRYTICTTSADVGYVGTGQYRDHIFGVPVDLYGVGAPGAATLEGFLVLDGLHVLHIRIDASDACAGTTTALTVATSATDATDVALVSPDTTAFGAKAMPNAFEGTVEYVF